MLTDVKVGEGREVSRRWQGAPTGEDRREGEQVEQERREDEEDNPALLAARAGRRC